MRSQCAAAALVMAGLSEAATSFGTAALVAGALLVAAAALVAVAALTAVACLAFG